MALIDFRNFLNTAKTAINTATPDGENTTLGSKADVAATSGDATPFSSIALLKGIFNKLTNTLTVQVSGSNAPLSGQKTVAAAGTAEALGGDQEYKKITVIADADNTGDIYIGASVVDSVTGGKLPAGGWVDLEFVNTNEIYIDAEVSGEGVSWIGVV